MRGPSTTHSWHDARKVVVLETVKAGDVLCVIGFLNDMPKAVRAEAAIRRSSSPPFLIASEDGGPEGGHLGPRAKITAHSWRYMPYDTKGMNEKETLYLGSGERAGALVRKGEAGDKPVRAGIVMEVGPAVENAANQQGWVYVGPEVQGEPRV